MNLTPYDPNLPFDAVVDEIKRVHQSRRSHCTARHAHPRSMPTLERKRKLRWAFGAP